MKRSAKPFLTIVVLGAMALVAGCKPKAGATCKIETKEVCNDAKQALACHDGKWEEMTCRGPAGCAKNGGEGTCDQSVAEDKDVCNLNGDFVCSGDKKSMLECQKNRWTFVQNCFGERACTMEAKKVTCDNSLANKDDACREEEDYACAMDHKSALVCRQGKFVVASLCKGKKACNVTGDKASGYKVECDDSIAQIGDPCDKEGHFACSADEKQIVKCKDKKFVGDDKCGVRNKSEKCQVKGELVGCY